MSIDTETGEHYEVEQGFTKTDYMVGGLWTVVGVFGLIRAHLAGQIKSIRGY